MSRQRTINDSFWRDPAISDLSQEDKATLLYLLTSPSSNIIGVYTIVPRIASAEMGWSGDQFNIVLKRLAKKGLIAIKAEWVWIRIWWCHNSARAAFSPKMRDNAIKQLHAIPQEWLDDYLAELHAVGIDRASIPHRYTIDTSPPPHRHPAAAPPPNSSCTYKGSLPRRQVGEHLAGLRAAITPQEPTAERTKP